jgi:predicted transcriptional regulator
MNDEAHLSRRERQIMDIVYARGEAAATGVLADIADPPSRTAVRTMLRILEDKGYLGHRKVGREFYYLPIRPRAKAGQSAMRRVLSTFFEGSLEKAVAAHLADEGTELAADDLKRLATLIQQARGKGK